MKKNIFSVIILLAAIFLLAVPVSASEFSECDSLPGNNINAQDYIVYGSPVYSYLTKSGSGYMRVQGNLTEDGRSDAWSTGTQEVYAVYYDSNYERTGWKKIPQELPRFGGFYETAQNYFLVTGQNNPNESDAVEVFRITKYDKNWNRIASCGLFGANTRNPFEAGSCRMDSAGNILVVRTCHKMYKSATDGQNHQAAATILVDMEKMEVLDSQMLSESSYMIYVGHSFNQFIKIENNKIVAVDQSDVRPRGIGITFSPADISVREWDGYSLSQTMILSTADPLVNNLTGAAVGGFEITNEGYLVAGNTVVQDEKYYERETYNVFAGFVDRATGEVSLRYMTSYAEGESTARTPHLVRVSADKYLMLWTREENLYYVFVDGKGNNTSEIYSCEGELSDCVPLITGGKAIWYTWDGGAETFYEISLDAPNQVNKTEHSFGHEYKWIGTENGLVHFECSKCGSTHYGKAPSSFSAFWRKAGSSGYYSNRVPTGLEAGDAVELMISDIFYPKEGEETYSGFVVETDDPEHASVSMTDESHGTITFSADGTYTVTIFPEYNPQLKKTAIFRVPDAVEPVKVESVIIWGGTVEVPATKTYALDYDVLPSNAEDRSLKWTSSAPSIASVDENGVVTGHRVGSAEITATANDGGANDYCTVKVLFSDVTDPSKAQFQAIYSLVNEGIIAGFKNGEYFAPNDQCTRAQVVLFLWRAAGKPNPKSMQLKFKDAADIKKLAPDYAKAIAWGNENGIVMGFTSGANKGKFMPNDACTRAQIVLFLYRFADMPATTATKLTFKDASEIEKMAPAYTKAILWANETGVAGGYKVSGGYEFKPNRTCTRGECATFLFRALNVM